MIYLGVELHGVNILFRVLESREGAVLGMCRGGEALWKLGDAVCVAHPRHRRSGELRVCSEKSAMLIVKRLGLTVLGNGAGLDLSAEGVGYQLCAVAYTEYRYAEPEYLFSYMRGALIIDAVGASRKDNAFRGELFYLVERCFEGAHLAVNSALSDASCDQLVILSAEIEDDDKFVLHSSFCLSF